MESSESLIALRGMTKKNHISQMWWIQYAKNISEIEPEKEGTDSKGMK